ncbi:surfactin synthase thioesterase subunit [Saccharothrix tamanrassetensis]|uniref:Surfactin synthase thioesterase subunit n=1 Tax=Saccharothrix tamanrassetensis TaxID=1051531 RepID=A0A841CDD4_9PSEU|nr:alpha/beta fold hydrolase [Saccharothrix tamanrassetensis]MBB5953766.1 surfactin synthase thioesterase subunit [Saccharothrix tamanrassetensis]
MTSPWLKPPTTDAPVLLYCVAHAGGGAAFFRPWRDALAPDVGVCPVVLPGREARLRETPCTAVDQIVPPLAAAISAHADRPYALFGHSMGAVIAYEVARTLSTLPDGPSHLFVSGRRAPHLPARRDPLHPLPHKEFMPAVAAMGGTPAEVLDQPDLIRMFLPGLRADFTVNETYEHRPGPALDCPVTGLTGDTDPEVDLAEMRRWNDITTGPFRLRVFRGGHFYLTGPPAEVANALRTDLAAAC